MRRYVLIFIGILTALLIAAPAMMVIIQGNNTSPEISVHNAAFVPYTTSSNNTSKPWWDVAWNDVTGVIGTAGSDAAHWLDEGLVGTYNAITSNIGSFFGNIVMDSVETTMEDVLGVFLSLVELAAAEVSNLFGNFITFLVGIAIIPALGAFGPVIALVVILAIIVFAVIIVRLVLDIA